MKKNILILLLLYLFSCQKEEILPQLELITVEVYMNNLDSINANLTISISGENIHQSEDMVINQPGLNQRIYRKQFYYKKNNKFYIKIQNNNNKINSYISTYIDSCNKTLIMVEKETYIITLADSSKINFY